MIHRSLDHLTRISGLFPRFWRQYDQMRADRGHGLPDWPTWCYCPIAGAYSVVSGGGSNTVPLGSASLIGDLAALAAWRPTKGIYRFDPDLGRALVETPIAGDIPVDVLYRLPEWCCYIETAGLIDGVHGAFVHLEWDANDGRTELRLLIDRDSGLQAIPLHVDDGGLAAAVDGFASEAAAQAALGGMAFASMAPPSMRREIAELAAPIISLALYLCSDEPDYVGGLRPIRQPRVSKGGKERGAEVPRVWDVGLRIGAALRAARERDAAEGEGTHASPRPHVRRAHWHTYRVGVGKQQAKLKWLSPILVGAGETVATVRKVE